MFFLPSVLSLNYLKVQKTKPVKNICIHEIFILQGRVVQSPTMLTQAGLAKILISVL